MKHLYLSLAVLFLATLTLSACAQTAAPATSTSEPPEEGELNPAGRIWAKIVPEEGTATVYGMPLSLQNTGEFINGFNSIELSADEQDIRDAALQPLVAPCCDDYSMNTC